MVTRMAVSSLLRRSLATKARLRLGQRKRRGFHNSAFWRRFRPDTLTRLSRSNRLFGSSSPDSLESDLLKLNSKISGEVILPSSKSKYDQERTQWNTEHNNLQPSAVIKAESAQDVSSALEDVILRSETSQKPVPFTVRSAALGGHLWSGYSVANNSVVIDLSRINTIEKVPHTQEACGSHGSPGIFKIGVGASQGSVNKALAPFSALIPTSGDCPQFAFGGFVQGGGLSLFLRSVGIAADFLVAADVVLTDGTIVHATENNQYKDLLFGIKGGGAGNMGIITHYYLKSIQAPQEVLSFEVYWDLPDTPDKIARFLHAWQATQANDCQQEWTSWLVVLNTGDKYVIRMLGIWNGDVAKGREAWDAFDNACGLEYNQDQSNITVTSPYNAVDIHQATFAGDEFRGLVDARTVKNEWNQELIDKTAKTMVQSCNKCVSDGLSYIWLFVRYGGAMRLNDVNNERTAFGNRDAHGDVTVLISYDEDDTLRRKARDKMEWFNRELLNPIGSMYYPNHPRSFGAPDAPVSVAYYDAKNKPWLYEKLQMIKSKYDPNNLLCNTVTITPTSARNNGSFDF